MIFATPETGFGIDGNWFEDRRKAPLRKQTQRPRIGLLLDLVELLLKMKKSKITFFWFMFSSSHCQYFAYLRGQNMYVVEHYVVESGFL